VTERRYGRREELVKRGKNSFSPPARQRAEQKISCLAGENCGIYRQFSIGTGQAIDCEYLEVDS
jgi:hypothetical protein